MHSNTPSGSTIDVLSRESARQYDAIAMNEYGIPGIVLMENAAIGISGVIRSLLPECGNRIVTVCGSGNNGGDGWAVARHLANDDQQVTVLSLGEPRSGTDAWINCRISRNMGIQEDTIEHLRSNTRLANTTGPIITSASCPCVAAAVIC